MRWMSSAILLLLPPPSLRCTLRFSHVETIKQFFTASAVNSAAACRRSKSRTKTKRLHPLDRTRRENKRKTTVRSKQKFRSQPELTDVGSNESAIDCEVVTQWCCPEHRCCQCRRICCDDGVRDAPIRDVSCWIQRSRLLCVCRRYFSILIEMLREVCR